VSITPFVIPSLRGIPWVVLCIRGFFSRYTPSSEADGMTAYTFLTVTKPFKAFMLNRRPRTAFRDASRLHQCVLSARCPRLIFSHCHYQLKNNSKSLMFLMPASSGLAAFSRIYAFLFIHYGMLAFRFQIGTFHRPAVARKQQYGIKA